MCTSYVEKLLRKQRYGKGVANSIWSIMTPSPLVGCINCIWSPSKASYWHTATMRGANRCQKSFIYYNNCYLHIVCNVASTPLAVLKPWWDNPPIRSTIWGLFKGDLDWQTEHGQSFWHVCNRESTQAWKIWIRDVLRHRQCIYRVMHQQARVATETLVGLKKVSELPWLRLRLYIDISCHPHCMIPNCTRTCPHY